jgi:4-amino-4-deoxy-L-arabinose transferase-like glycosyltransferase
MTTLTESPDRSAPQWRAPIRVERQTGLRDRWPELLILVASAVFLTWGLTKNGYGNEYYAAAVRSMTKSWNNFLFGPVDPGGWITTDKPPLALWLGAASARVFGYSRWSVLMPSVVCGVASVGLLMAAVRRAWGPWGGRAAGVVLAVTPVFVAVSRVNNPDATLVLCMVAAAWATQRAISDDSRGWLIVAGAFCGLAFLTKLLVAGLVMPGAFAAYLVAGRAGWWQRVRDVIFAGIAFIGVAAVWVAVVDLTPASNRPYIGNTTDNTAWNLVFGTHGFGVLTGNESFGTGAVPGLSSSTLTPLLAHLPGLGGSPGIARLFNGEIGDQVMWLVVPAALALVAGVVLWVRRRLSRPEAGSLVMWGGYALVAYFVFAYTHGVFHDYYVSAFAPAVAALVGIGVAMAQRAGRRGVAWVVAALAGTAVVQVVFLRRVDAYSALRVAVPVGLVVVALVMLGALLLHDRVSGRVLAGALVAGLVLALLAPAVWSLWAVRHPEDAGYASAGPPLSGQARTGTGSGVGGIPNAATAGLPADELAWLRAQHRDERWIVAVPSDLTAADAIVHDDSILPMGGFYGSDPAMTPSKLADLVGRGELRFVDTGGFALGDPNQIKQLVGQVCAKVAPTAWQSTAPGSLYDCAGRQDAIRTTKLAPIAPPRAAPAGAPTGGYQLGPPAAVAKLVACLRDHGWTPTAASSDPSTPAARTALAACASLIHAAVPSAPAP